jgi:hypothetical protein
LLDAELKQPHGGRVTYLAEVAEPVRDGCYAEPLSHDPRSLRVLRHRTLWLAIRCVVQQPIRLPA